MSVDTRLSDGQNRITTAQHFLAAGLGLTVSCWAAVATAATPLEAASIVPHPFEAPVPQEIAPPAPRALPINVAAILTNRPAEIDPNDVAVNPDSAREDEKRAILPVSHATRLTPATSTTASRSQTSPATTGTTRTLTAFVPPPEPLELAPLSAAPFEQSIVPRAPSSQPPRRLSSTPNHYGSHMLNSHFCDECGLLTCRNKRQHGFFFDGWLSQGVSLNGRERTVANTPLRFTDLGNDYALNQLYLTFGRSATKRDRIDAGFRVDVLYGSDYFWTSALGLETEKYITIEGIGQTTTLDPRQADGRWNIGSGNRGLYDNRYRYGLSLPQFYSELYLPIGSGTTLKAGHFYSDFGLESVMAPENTFYSHSYSFMFGSPITLSGGTLTQRLGRRLSVTAGITTGWDIWDNPTRDLSFLLGATWKRAETGTHLSWALMSGRTDNTIRHPRTHYVLTLRQQISPNVRVGLEHTLGWEKEGSYYQIDPRIIRRDSTWASLAGVVETRITSRLDSNFRAEWFRDKGYARIDGMTPLTSKDSSMTGSDYFALTYGLRWQPHRMVTIRPEIRYDWSDVRRHNDNGTTDGPFAGQEHLLTTSLDMILRF